MELLLIVGLIIGGLSLLDALAVDFGGETREAWLDVRVPPRISI